MFHLPLKTSSLFSIAILTAALSVPVQAQIKKVPIHRTSSGSGASMYFSYCASCHNLTNLSKQNKSEFPTAKVAYILGNMPGTAAHGNSSMPVWGDR